MAEKRINCRQCRRYDKEEGRCRDGKANPKRKSDAVEVAEALGVQRLCLYNPYRDDLALRTYFPSHPLLVPRALWRRIGKIDVDVEPQEETDQAVERLD
jgi:hypothetical protein